MNNYNFFAVDIGNSWYKVLASDQGEIAEYHIPNAIALYDDEFYEKPYDEEDIDLEENMIVEVKSPAVINKREIFYAGKSAAKQRNVSLTASNNQKADEDRTYVLLFAAAAYHASIIKPDDIEITYCIDQLAVSLPTTQYKDKKRSIKAETYWKPYCDTP